MPRVLDSQCPGSTPRSHAATERVSRGRTHVPLLSRRFRLIGLVLAAIPAIVWWDASQPAASAPDRLALAGHTLLVQSVVFSPDGRTLASCGSDRAVRLWDVAGWGAGDWTRSDVLRHDSPPEAVAFSPDGQTLVTSAAESLVVWSRDGTAGRMVERSGETSSSLAFSPDGRTLALGGVDGSVRLWEMPGARERAVLRDSTTPVHSLTFSPDGTLLAWGDHEGRVTLREASGAGQARILRGATNKPVRTVAFTPDGRTLGVADPAGAVDALLFDVETGAVRGRLPGRPLGIAALAFSPDGRWLASSSGEEVRLVDIGRQARTARRQAGADRINWTGTRS